MDDKLAKVKFQRAPRGVGWNEALNSVSPRRLELRSSSRYQEFRLQNKSAKSSAYKLDSAFGCRPIFMKSLKEMQSYGFCKSRFHAVAGEGGN